MFHSAQESPCPQGIILLKTNSAKTETLSLQATFAFCHTFFSVLQSFKNVKLFLADEYKNRPQDVAW